MSVLSVSDLSLTIQDQRILHRISMEVSKGEVVGLIGPNRSGNTTFFNVLSGFLRASHGKVSFRDLDITGVSATERARLGIGRVFQTFGIFRDMTLEENVLVAFESLPKEQRHLLGDLKHAVHETLKMVHLLDHAKKKASSLSGGQMRLLEIARTLAARKDLFLLDERLLTQLVNDLSPFFARHCDELALLGFDRLLALCGKVGVPKSALDLSLSLFKHREQRFVEKPVKNKEEQGKIHRLNDEELPVYSECG